MARTSNLIQRGGRWYFNKAYPKELWPVVGRAPFRMALNTDALEQAQRMRGHAEQRYWAAVDAARKKLGEVAPRALTEVEAVAIVSRWFLQRNEELDRSHLHQPTPPEGLEDARQELADIERFTSDKLSRSAVEGFAPLAARVLEAEGIKADPAGGGYRTMLQLLARANKELGRIDLARLQGDFGYRPTDPVFLSALIAPSTAKRTINDLIDAYEREKAPGWSPSTKAAHGPVWRVLRDVLGSSRDVATLTRDDGRRLFETVKALPKGLAKVKELAGLSVPVAVERAARQGMATIGPKTVNGSYMAFLSSMFGWAVKEQWLKANPVAGLTVVDAVDAADKRDPFSVEQLKAIFRGAPWSPRDPAPRGKPLHYWGPLLALFHGMRRGEIAQLRTSDVLMVDGIMVMRVRKDAETGRRTKTMYARRIIPVHPQLERMGFLAFVDEQRRGDHAELFPGSEPNANGQWGDNFSDWFTRLVASHRLTGQRLGLHSFRHNFEDALRAAGLKGSDIGRALAGRARQGGNDSGDTYGSGYPATQLADALALVTYPGLDLSHLHVVQLREDASGN
ncbi:site-specific integrase [Sphingomonas rubra]|uniref:Phage integrase family protein n=1 Tax=Sphingomonas rubra TaxID=634430 RepID=A0A1I5R9G1_9SPHN|nr:site-specific integrase [Sphingomonas rubra]SFP55149.1 Phage integrase family protein [Sphingomonas rubra]